MSEYLSLAELESFDPRSPRGRMQRRFCCPLCGTQKSITPEHRSLAVNTDSGAWICHRCGRDGLLKEYWKERPSQPFHQRTSSQKRATLAKIFTVDKTLTLTPVREATEEEKLEKLRLQYKSWQEVFPGSLAASYLCSRGIPEQLAIETGCGYASDWQHWEQKDGKWVLVGKDQRIVFPVCDREGNLVSVNARAIGEKYFGAKAISRGPKKLGVFSTCQNLITDMVTITEAPIDALSLHLAGYPAIAMIGTSWPDWLWLHCGFRVVGIATDADEAGDVTAAKLEKMLRCYGSRCVRLRPQGAKDWNELLLSEGLRKMKSRVNGLVESLAFYKR